MSRPVCYLLHFIDPGTGEPARYRHAGHYLGSTEEDRLDKRVQEHRDGEGGVLTRAARAAGLDFVVTRTWPGGRLKERQLKSRSGASYCPDCTPEPMPGLRERRPGARYLTRRQREAAAAGREQAAPEPEPRRRLWQMDRDGEWLDGTPIIFDPDQTWAQARAEAARHPVPELTAEEREELAALDELERRWTEQEDHVGLKDAAARVADTVRGYRESRQREASAREADRLWAIADELDKQMGRQPGHQYELTAERAARIRAQIGEDLVQDARAQGPAEARAHGPELEGAERDAEIARLAESFSEPLFGPRPDGTYADAIGAEEAEQDAMYEEGEDEAYLSEQFPEPGTDAAAWSPALEDATAPGAADGLVRDLEEAAADAEMWRRHERAALAGEHLAQEAHARFRAASSPEVRAWAAPEAALAADQRQTAAEMREHRHEAEADAYDAAAALQDAALIETHAEPMERMSASPTAHPGAAPVASALPAGTAHADPALAERGWQAGPHGVYVRNPDAEAPGARRELAGYEAGTPDHLYGSPDCAEADPETAHFGTGPGEPQDAGQPAASFATHGHQMYPEMLAGLREGHAEIAQHMGQGGEYPHPSQAQYQAEAV